MKATIILEKITVTMAAPVVFSVTGTTINTPLSIGAVPGAEGTLLVEFKIHPDGVWWPWDKGTVSANTADKLEGAVSALRFTAETADGVVELGS